MLHTECVPSSQLPSRWSDAIAVHTGGMSEEQARVLGIVGLVLSVLTLSYAVLWFVGIA